MARRAIRPAAAIPRPGGRGKAGVIILVVVLLLIFSLPSVLLLLFGMLPAIVTYITDQSKQKAFTICVGGMNFAGVFPYLLTLWTGDHSIGAALGILTDVFALMVMYSAAAFGWVLFLALPPLVGGLLSAMAKPRIASLRASQKRIIEEWGPDVAGAAERAETDGPALSRRCAAR